MKPRSAEGESKPGGGFIRKEERIKKILLAEVVLIFFGLTAVIRVGLSGRADTDGNAAEVTETADSDIAQAELASEEDEEAGELLAMVTAVPEPEFSPHCTTATDPANLIAYTEIEVNGTKLTDISQYQSTESITFQKGKDYTELEGVVTFRGNNFRDSPVYGTASEMTEYKLSGVWQHQTGGLTYNGASWSGSGWTGQPLLVKWPKEVKVHMDMEDWAKEKDDLVEVIYACMDGYVYFLDMETGEATRDPLYLGFTFKGAGALDPRGYPILYVGAGYNSNAGTARVFVVNLLDCSVMYTFGDNDTFSLRGSLSFFDSSALVDAETDTLIYPGENGILYLIHLNTNYNADAGTLSIDPDRVVKWRYYGTRTSVGSYWLGMEDSAVVYGGYLFIADNGGNFMCLDLNTLELVWVQDVLDDTNGSSVMSIENGHPYLYISTSFHLGWRSSYTAEIPIWKLDAETGAIVWQTSYECESAEDLSGGVQSTPAIGKNGLDDYLYVTVSRTGGMNNGVLACLQKDTGEIVWEHEAAYAWSSPVCVYDSDGVGKVLYGTSAGKLYLLDGTTGETDDTLVLSQGVIEASPAVYDNMVILGTRDCEIWGIRLQ